MNSDGSSDENKGRDSDDNKTNDNVNVQQRMCRQLAACAARNRWSRSSINEVLGILRDYGLKMLEHC